MCKRVVVGVVLTVAALVAVAAIRLMDGPVDLDFLKERIARAVDVPGNDIRPSMDRIALEWGGISQPMRLVFTGLRFTNEQGQVIASAPSASLTFDARNAFQGVFLPTSITIERPAIEAEIDRDGGMLRRIFTSSSTETQGEAVSILVEQLLSEPNYKSLIGQLDMVEITKARVTLHDIRSGLTWVAPAARVELKRDDAGVVFSADARITGNAGHFVDVSLGGVYARDRSRISVDASVRGLKPAMLADLSPDAALLRGIDVPLFGRLSIEADGQGDVNSVSVDITGANGSVTLPGVLPAIHPVKALKVRASMDSASNTAKLDGIDLEFGAARVSIVGAGERKSGEQTFSGRASIAGIPVDHLGDYWPLAFAEGGREWALANLSHGEIDVTADFALSTRGNDLSALKVDRMVGLIGYRDMTVRYMPHMPELQGVSGTARYEDGALHFDVAGGSAVNLKTAGATIDLVGLDKPPPQYATIRIPISGAAPDVIRFLARPKLGLPKNMLYDYRRLGGQVAVDVSLAFPLLNALTVSELDIEAEASLSDFSLRGAIGNVDLSDAAATIKYANSELAVEGTGKLDGNSVHIAWHEWFSAKAPLRRRYELKGTVPASLVAKAGFPSPEPFVTGPIGTTLQYQVAANGTGDVTGRIDLKGASADVPELDWRKEPGTDGQLQATVKLAAGGKLVSIDFDGRSDDLRGKGSARFAGDSVLQQIALQQFRIGRTDLSIDWKRMPNAAEITVRGLSLELPRVRSMIKARDAAASGQAAGATTSASITKMTLQVQQVLTQRGTAGYVNGRLDLAGDRIAAADLSIGAGKGSTLRVTPTAQGGRKLFLYVANFGSLLSDAGWIDGLVDGYLHIEGQYNDAAASRLDGFLKLGPYRLQRVVQRPDIGTLNSAIDGLNRAGNALQQFDNLEASLSKQGDRIHVRNGRTSGQSIGLTAQGYVDIGNDTARLTGVVVPAFALNNLLSNVPLLGPLLTGGKDGGVFAISYLLHGPFDDLKTDVNMMSAVTPGALREIFTAPADPNPPPPSQEMMRAP